jgi:WD40 repeat protein
MSDSDDEETAKLRAMRSVAARMDARGGGGMQELLDRQRRVAQASRSSAFFDDEGDAAQPSKRARQGASPPKAAAPAVEDEDAALRAMFPGGFGGSKHAPRQRSSPPRERAAEGPSRPAAGPSSPPAASSPDARGPPSASVADGDEDDARGDGDSEDERDERLPVSDEAKMEGHRKVVSALALEHTGSRLLTGSHDYTVRMYDFNGMKRDLRPFREITPSDGYPVHALSWSPSGDRFLVVTGGAQPKVFDRDGRELGECDKGDMYIRDMKNTKGHCSPCTGGVWHPLRHDTALTAGADGTMRTWALDRLGDARGAQAAVLKPQLSKPGRFQVTSCAYSADGALIAGGVTDGTIQLFPSDNSDRRANAGVASVPGSRGASAGAAYRSASVGLVLPPSQQCHVDNAWSFAGRPRTLIRDAHPAGESVTSLAFSRDGNTLLSRCADGTLRVWDVRRFKTPVKTFEGLETTHEETAVGFSPGGEYFFTGADAPRARADLGDGALAVFDTKSLSLVRRIGTPGNCVAALWHERLNQLFLGCGDGKSGTTLGLYDAKRSSQRGLLACVGRAPRAASRADFVRVDESKTAYAPHALPMFREPMPGRAAPGDSERARRKDAVKTKMPRNTGAGARGAAGALGAGTGGTLLTQHIMRNNDMLGEKNWRQNDPREAILRHAADAEANPWRTNNAYAETQPKPIFAEPERDEEDESD